MSTTTGLLAAQAFRDGRATRQRSWRHISLIDDPIVLVPWTWGGEPFAFPAVGYGTPEEGLQVATTIFPLDRVQLFPKLVEVARWFNEKFEAPWAERREWRDDKGNLQAEVFALAQVVVPSLGGIKALGDLGRRLAFLPTDPDAEISAPAELVRFGRHLLWLNRRATWPGQQQLVDLVTATGEMWMTPQTETDRANLPALDAWVAPPGGLEGYTAAREAETISVGPLARPDDENPLYDAAQTHRAADRPAIRKAKAAVVEQGWRDLTEQAWDVSIRSWRRLLELPEEPRWVAARAADDRAEYVRHMMWMEGPVAGRRRARETVRQAIYSRSAEEEQLARLEAEIAASDPLARVDLLLDGKGVEGPVIASDFRHMEIWPGNSRRARAPMLTLRCAQRAVPRPGSELWWTDDPARLMALVRARRHNDDGSWDVDLMVRRGVRGQGDAALKQMVADGRRVAFTTLTPKSRGFLRLQPDVPFTHQPAMPVPTEDHLEDGGTAA